jgi:hypothetical protein
MTTAINNGPITNYVCFKTVSGFVVLGVGLAAFTGHIVSVPEAQLTGHCVTLITGMVLGSGMTLLGTNLSSLIWNGDKKNV